MHICVWCLCAKFQQLIYYDDMLIYWWLAHHWKSFIWDWEFKEQIEGWVWNEWLGQTLIVSLHGVFESQIRHGNASTKVCERVIRYILHDWLQHSHQSIWNKCKTW